MRASSKNAHGHFPGGQEFKPSLKQRPFLISRVVLTNSDATDGGEKRPKLCKKCESMTVGVGSDSIHSTLAYSRCRCHRLFKYRKRRQAANLQETVVSSKLGDLKLDRIKVKAGPKLSPGRHLSGVNINKRHTEDLGRLPIVERRHAVLLNGAAAVSKGSILPELEVTPPVAKQQQHRRQQHQKQDQEVNRVSSKSRFTSPGRKMPKSKQPVGSSSELKLTSITRISSPLQLPSIPSIHSTQQVKKNQFTSQITELVDMVKFIDASKRKTLRDMFREIDKNGDGHIACAEFLSIFPECTLVNASLLKQFYAVLNDDTYFGCREFMLCYCIAESLNKMRASSAFIEVTMEFVESILNPFMRFLTKLANDGGKVTLQNIKDSVADVNQELGNAVVCVSESTAEQLTQVINNGKFHILDCIALSCCILSYNTKLLSC